MNTAMYETWKKSLAILYAEHDKLLGYNVKAGIGVSGNLQIQINELEERIKEIEAKIKDHELKNGINPKLNAQSDKTEKSLIALTSIAKVEDLNKIESTPLDIPKANSISEIKEVATPKSEDKTILEIMKTFRTPLIIFGIIGLCIIAYKGGIFEFLGLKVDTTKSKTSDNKENATASPPSPTEEERATIIMKIATNDYYLKSEKVENIYLTNDFLNEGNVDNSGTSVFRKALIPHDKFIKVMVDFKGGKVGESKIIDLSHYTKDGLGRYLVEQLVNITKVSESTSKNNSKPANSNASSLKGDITINFNPKLEQKVILIPKDSLKNE